MNLFRSNDYGSGYRLGSMLFSSQLILKKEDQRYDCLKQRSDVYSPFASPAPLAPTVSYPAFSKGTALCQPFCWVAHARFSYGN